MPKPTDRRLRNALIRILHGESDLATEAAALNVSKRTLQRHLAAWKEANPSSEPSPDDVSPSDIPPGNDAQDKPNEALDAALKAAGEGGGGSQDDRPTPADVGQARADMSQFCIEAIGQIKSAIGSGIVMVRYAPPLSLDMKPVQDALKLSPLAEAAIRTNAERLYPVLVRMMSGPFQLTGALVVESLLLIVGLNGLAVQKGWKAPEKKKRDEEKAYKPWVQTWSGSAQPPPQVKVPEEGIKSVDATNGPFGKVQDAPPMEGAA
jgi:hypothetical protein